MDRRILVVSLLIAAFAMIVAPAAMALSALLQGERELAVRIFAPVLLIPLGFVLAGVAWSFRSGADRKPRTPPR